MRDQIQKRVMELDKKLAASAAMLAERKRAVEVFESEIRVLTQDVDLLTKTTQVLLMVSAKVLGQSVETIDKLVTSGLRLTFDDQDLQFRTKIEKQRGKTALKFELFQDGRAVPLLQSYGGGVLVTAGVLMRVVTIIVLGLKRVLILDESLSHLSVRYVPNLAKLLRKIASELGFTVLLITHEPEFAAEADRHYVLESKEGSTLARLVKG